MKNFKKLIAIMMVIALMIPSMAMAAESSSTKTSIADAVVTVEEATYTGAAQKAVVSAVILGEITLVEGTDYTVEEVSKTDAGSYEVVVTGIGAYEGEAIGTFTIAKATQSVKVKTNYKAKKASTFKKKSKKYKITVKNAKGSVTYKVKKSKGSSKIKVSSKGKITIKKGIKKGTYKIKVTVAATDNYKAYTKTIKIKVK